MTCNCWFGRHDTPPVSQFYSCFFRALQSTCSHWSNFRCCHSRQCDIPNEGGRFYVHIKLISRFVPRNKVPAHKPEWRRMACIECTHTTINPTRQSFFNIHFVSATITEWWQCETTREIKPKWNSNKWAFGNVDWFEAIELYDPGEKANCLIFVIERHAVWRTPGGTKSYATNHYSFSSREMNSLKMSRSMQ